MYSSAVLDCLAAKKPVIEFWLNNIDNIDFIKDKKNDWISIYTKLDLVEPVNNYNLLEKKIKKILKSRSLPINRYKIF